MPITYNELYIETRRRFRDAGIEAHDLEARLIVAHAAGKAPARLLADLRLYTSDQVAQTVETLAARRLAGEPVAYITGSWEFYGLPLKITPDVLIPRSDTEVLVDTALSLAEARGGGVRILDLCTGSGCIGCALASRLPAAHVVLLDLSPKALEVARENLRSCGLGTRAVAMEADAMAEPDTKLGSFDMIVSNPPYIAPQEIETLDPSVKDYEPRMALDGGKDGLDFYRSIAFRWKKLLRASGHLVFEVGETQAEQVMHILRLAGFRGIGSEKDTAGIQRVVYGRV